MQEPWAGNAGAVPRCSGVMPCAALLALLAGAWACDDAPPSGAPCRDRVNGELVCGDFGNALGTTEELVLVGRVIEEDTGFDPKSVTPAHDLEQDELEEVEVELRLKDLSGKLLRSFPSRTDEEGWVNARLDLVPAKLSPGSYFVDVFVGRAWAARLGARLVDPEHTEPAVVSDVDLTYLDTNFHTASALAELVTQPASARVTLPGMARVYAALRGPRVGADARPLTFLSGSPTFFRRTLAQKMQLDAVEHDGLVLKPMKLLLLNEVLGDLSLRDLVAALGGDRAALLGPLVDQIGYKLTALLSHSLELPATTPLILMGDDSEGDHVVYNLFHRFMAGELALEELTRALDDLEVDATWIEAIEIVGPIARAHRAERESPVLAVYINQTAVPNAELPIEDWLIFDLFRHHDGAWPLSLSLYAEGWLERPALEEVRAELEKTQGPERLARAANSGVESGYLSEELVQPFARQ